jgi:hypothetical protein
MFKKFTNYIEERKEGVDAKSGLVGSPKVKLVADYDGPDPHNPTKGQGQGDLAPYKSANGNAAAQKAEKGGFADLGDSKLKYEPDMKDGNSKLTALGKELGGDWPKGGKLSKTEQFLNKTSDLSASEFAKYMAKQSRDTFDNLPTVSIDESGHPHPSEAIHYIAALSTKNKKFIENLIFDMKRAGSLGRLLEAALEHPEAYKELTRLFGDEKGEKRARNLARAMALEAVGPPMGLGNGEANADGDRDMDDDKVEPEDDELEDDDDEETDPDEEHDDTDEDDDEEENGDFDDESDGDLGHDDEEGSDPFGKDDESPDQNVNPMKKKLPHEHLKDALQRAFMKAFMNK